MRVLKAMLTLLVLTNWLVCMALCHLEQTGLWHDSAEQCADQCAADFQTVSADCEAECSPICDWIVSGGLQMPKSRVSAPEFVALPVATFLYAALSDVISLPGPGDPGQSRIVPPELSSSVLFVLRTALPARAPSFIS